MTIASLLHQTVVPAQIVVVDQSENDEVRRRLEKLFAQAPASVREKTTLCHIYDPAIPGAAAARNRGMDAANGEILLFLDDDVSLEKTFLEEILAAYERNPSAVGVSGVFTNYKAPSWMFRCWTRMFHHGPFWDERQSVYWNADRLRRSKPIHTTKFTGALMSFRAQTVRGLRFDENVRATSAEDVDFCARIPRKKGDVLLMAPRARLLHKLSSPGRSRKHWLYTETERAYYLYTRNWKHGLKNRLCLGWLTFGYCLAATCSSLRRGSLEPWRAVIRGIQLGKEEALAGSRH
jgi:GT2 family glycosyltransferase